MNSQEKLQLQNMIKEHNVADNTNLIRKLKHSQKIYEDVNKMLNLKKTHKHILSETPELFNDLCSTNCSFIFNHYTDIFNKVLKDEINLDVLLSLINTLRQIEEGNLDQHEGSYAVGHILKKIYIDSALKKAEKLDNPQEKIETKVKNLSWKEYKNKNL